MLDAEMLELAKRLERLEAKMRNQKMLARFKPPMLESDLSMKDFTILSSLSREDNAAMGELSERLSINLSTLTRAADKLVTEELIIRQNDPGDRRIVRVSLASKGKKIMEDANKKRREMMISFITSLSREDRRKFVDLLENLTNLLTDAYTGKDSR